MKSLSQFVKHNNWEKLDENIQMVSENNFTSLVSTSVVYHSKECFDILMKLPNRINWINKQRGHWKLRRIFENYAYGPNKSNEYYLAKTLEILEYIDTAVISNLLVNKSIFHMVFEKIVKTKSALSAVIYRVCENDDIEAFMLIHKFLSDNIQEYSFYTNDFVINCVLFEAICSGAINIIKKLHELGYNLSKIKHRGQDVSTLVLTLTRINDIQDNKSDMVFKFLYGKYPQFTQNILWANRIAEYNYSDSYDYFLKLNFNWVPTVDFSKILEDYVNNYVPQPIQALTQDNLILQFQTTINEILADGDYSEAHYYFSDLIHILDYLIGLGSEYPEITQYLKTVLILPEINLMELICSIVYSSLKSIHNNYLGFTSKYYRRSRRIRMRSRRIKSAGEKLEGSFNIVRFMKLNKLSDFNPLRLEYFDGNLSKGKQYTKLILSHLMNMGFPVSDEFKKSVVDKVFNKTELKSLDTTIKLLKAENFAKDLRAVGKPKKTAKKRTSKKKVHVPAMDDSDSDDGLIPDHEILPPDVANQVETDSDSDSDSGSEIEV